MRYAHFPDHTLSRARPSQPCGLRQRWQVLVAVALLGLSAAWAQTDCSPSPPEDTQVVDRGPIKTVQGPLARFDPCHRSVRLDRPSFFSPRRGELPPLVLIAHGGGGLGGYERDFAKWLNQQGFATLVFDAFEMNGLVPRSDLLLYNMSNGGRQRMIYKATLGAYRWALLQPQIDTRKIFIQGLSNGGAVAINMAAAVDAAHVRGVIAEGAPSTGIGFPDAIQVPLLMVYGAADHYGGTHADDWMHLRAMPCAYNDHDPTAPLGFAQSCHRSRNPGQQMPSPQAWYERAKAQGQDVRFERIDGGGHGILFSDFSSSVRSLPGGRQFYRSQGAPADTRLRLQETLLAFIVERLALGVER
jgi:dienelactone hydrolase